MPPAPISRKRSFILFLLAASIAALCGGALETNKASATSAVSRSSAAVLVDLRSGRPVWFEDRGALLQRPLPVGSLLKLFAAYLFLEKGRQERHVVFCPPSSPWTPTRESCWFRPGHRNQDLAGAIAHSCDRYFLNIAGDLRLADFTALLERFELHPDIGPESGENYSEGETMIGLNPRWRFPVDSMLAAVYALLSGDLLRLDGGEAFHFSLRRSLNLDPQIVAVIRRGMRESALYGTSRPFQEEFAFRVLGKTGTFVMANSDPRQRRVSGIFLGFFPDPALRYAVLLWGSAGSGAQQAAAAAVIVKRLAADGVIDARLPR